MTISPAREDASARSLPGCYNDLDASLTHAWAMLVRGAADRRSAFHTPVVASVTDEGDPAQRVMVLRGVNEEARALRLHTDARSQKFAQVSRRPSVSLLFYDAHAKLQLRLAGTAVLHRDDATARAAWAASRPQSRLCYEQAAAPGEPMASPLPDVPVDQRFAATDGGLENFAVLMVTVDAVEWLYLAIEGHRRARWTWQNDAWTGTWLAP